ncbi:unnamed protein product [Adineta steineri]|uniref:G-protein coupled receptors family 1 profile domain-containing protein n=3 Tax=Adineta steineri TaxID=433720 RepID=A0A819JF48_9BILA|nr:unnamed protein product [Adineta steineri]CAF3932847.1 unnamed protein product [Adineta steineri]
MDAWTAQLRKWPMLSVLVFGQISNTLSVLVLTRPKLRKNTCSLYLIGASISNTICSFVSIFYSVLSSGFGYSLISQYRVLCKFLPYMYYSTLFLGSWFILLACIDRYCSTHARATIRQFSHIKTARWLLIFIPLLCFITHIHILIYIDWIQINRCSFITFDFLLFFYIYYVVIYAFMIPILYMIFAVLTIYNVRKTKKSVSLVMKRVGTMIQPQKRQQMLNAQLLRMLLVQVISFVILTMPLAAWNVYAGITAYVPKSVERRSIERLISVDFQLLTYINIGSTCVIYTITARLFREELQALFRCQWFKNAVRRQQQPSYLFSITRRIAPVH